jgi:hypothetical protein
MRAAIKLLSGLAVIAAASSPPAPALAHTSIYIPPPRFSHHAGGYGTPQGGHDAVGRFVRRIFGLRDDPPAGGVNVIVVSQPTGLTFTTYRDATWPDTSDMRPYIALASQTDSQRYFTATGRPLPAVHGLITLPPVTPKGDYTYIWATRPAP